MKKKYISILLNFVIFMSSANAEPIVNELVLSPCPPVQLHPTYNQLHFTYNKYDDYYNKISEKLNGLLITPKNPMGKTPNSAIYIYGEVDNTEDFFKKNIYIKNVKILVDHENPSRYSSLYGIIVKDSNIEIDNIDIISSKAKYYYGIVNKNNSLPSNIKNQVKSRVTINNGHLVFNGYAANGITAIMYSNNEKSFNQTEFNNSVMDLNGESNRGIYSVNSLVSMNSSVINLNNSSNYISYGIYALNNSNILINRSDIIGQASNNVGIYLGQSFILLDEDTLSTNNIEYLNKEPLITVDNGSNIKLQNSTAIFAEKGKGTVKVDNNSHIFSKNLIETKNYDKYNQNDYFPIELTLSVSNHSTVEGRTLTADATTSSINLLSNSTWNVTGNSVLTNLNVTDSVVNFKKDDDKFITTEVDTLNSSNATYNFAVDIVENNGSKLLINKSSNGKNIAQVTNDGGQNTTGNEKILLVEDKSGTNAKATFTSGGEGVELGGYLYTVNRDGNTNNWYLTGKPKPSTDNPGTVSPTAKTITGLASTSYLMNQAEMATLRQRMGDLTRANKTTPGDVSGAWGRMYGGNYKTRNNDNLAKADMNYYGFQLGGDVNTVHYRDNTNYLGVFMGHTTGKPDYDSGNATATSWYGGVYDTFIMDDEFYVDSALKLGQYRNKYNLKDSQSNAVNGKAHSSVITLSSQEGKRFTLTEADNYNVYTEPQAQLTYSRVGAFNTKASNDLRVKQASYNSTVARLGMLLGTQINKQSDIYLKTSYLHEFSKDVNYKLNKSTESYNVKGDGLEAGLGVNVKLNDNDYLYTVADYINSKSHYTGSKFNIGYRYSF